MRGAATGEEHPPHPARPLPKATRTTNTNKRTNQIPNDPQTSIIDLCRFWGSWQDSVYRRGGSGMATIWTSSGKESISKRRVREKLASGEEREVKLKSYSEVTRWMGVALLRAQEGFRRVRGHKELGDLAAALVRTFGTESSQRFLSSPPVRTNAQEQILLAGVNGFSYKFTVSELSEF